MFLSYWIFLSNGFVSVGLVLLWMDWCCFGWIGFVSFDWFYFGRISFVSVGLFVFPGLFVSVGSFVSVGLKACCQILMHIMILFSLNWALITFVCVSFNAFSVW